MLIDEEARAAYNRILLTPVLAGEKTFDEIVLHDEAWYARHGVTRLAGQPVTAIDRASRTVCVGGESHAYDKLVIATGSRPFMPPLPGIDLPGVYAFRQQADVEAMLSQLSAGETTVVLGGGVLGIEAAAALAQRGIHSVIVHRGPHLMDQQLDAHAATLLQASLNARGIDTLLAVETRACCADAQGRLSAVELQDGRRIPAQGVVVCAGVRPNIALAQAAGLACDRGIQVDGHLRTNDAAISAIGECCQFGEITFGLVAPCWRQAETLAARLLDEAEAPFALEEVPLRLKVSGLDLYCAGARVGDAVYTAADPFTGDYRRLVMSDNQLRGYCAAKLLIRICKLFDTNKKPSIAIHLIQV